MKKIHITLFTLLFYVITYSQVGIGNYKPRGVLDINKPDGTNTMGLILPSVFTVDNDTLSNGRVVPQVIKPQDPFISVSITEDGETENLYVPDGTAGAGAALGTLIFDESKKCLRVKHTSGNLDKWQDCLVDSQQVKDEINYQMNGAENFKMKTASAGYYWSSGIGQDDYLYAAGNAGYNRKGISGNGTWKRTYSAEKVTDIQSEVLHGFAVTESGKLLGWGRNEYGKIGWTTTGSNSPNLSVPTIIPVETNTSGVKKLAPARVHSIILMNDGKVYGTGYNGYGAVGLGVTTSPIRKFTQVTFTGLTPGTTIVDVDASYYNSGAIDSEGNIWTWGSNARGGNGSGTTSGNVTAPQKRIVPNVKFTKIAMNYAGGIAIGTDTSNKQVVYAWGDRRNINGGTTTVTVPTEVPSTFFPFEDGEFITHVDAEGYSGVYTTAIATNLNRVYVAGQSSSWGAGRTGVITETGAVAGNSYSLGYFRQCADHSIYEGTQITKLSLNLTHMIISTRNPVISSVDYTAYGTGLNNYQQLGVRPNSNFFLPVKK